MTQYLGTNGYVYEKNDDGSYSTVGTARPSGMSAQEQYDAANAGSFSSYTRSSSGDVNSFAGSYGRFSVSSDRSSLFLGGSSESSSSSKPAKSAGTGAGAGDVSTGTAAANSTGPGNAGVSTPGARVPGPGGSRLQLPLSPKMDKNVEQLAVGGDWWLSNPWFSDAGGAWQQRYGEPGEWLGGVVVGGADALYNSARLVDHLFGSNVVTPGAERHVMDHWLASDGAWGAVSEAFDRQGKRWAQQVNRALGTGRVVPGGGF